MQLSELAPLLTADGPFVTVHVSSESNVEQAADRYALQWKDIVRELSDRGVDERTRAAIEQARGAHNEGASRFVVASAATGAVALALSLDALPPQPLVDVAPLPHLLPLVDELTTQVPFVVAVVDREGAEAWSSAGTIEELDREGTVERPTTRGQARRAQRSTDNSWRGTEQDVAATVERMAREVDAELLLLAGETKTVAGVQAMLPATLQDKVVHVPGTRHADGSWPVLRQAIVDAVGRRSAMALMDLLADYAQERGQAKRACDGVADVVAALRKAQVQTLIITTGIGQHGTLLFGPEPTHLATTAQELRDLGATDVAEGPMVDVLLRAAIATGADVRLVPGELETAPQQGVGALLRYDDSSA